jgi:hypothetical protein
MSESTKGQQVSSGQSTEYGYTVEARAVHFFHFKPVVLSDGILSSEWREVVFERGNNPAGVPDHGLGQRSNHGLLGHEGAVALAWTLIAQHGCFGGIECRLVKHKLETTYKRQREGIVDMPPIKSSPAFEVKVVAPETLPQNTI